MAQDAGAASQVAVPVTYLTGTILIVCLRIGSHLHVTEEAGLFDMGDQIRKSPFHSLRCVISRLGRRYPDEWLTKWMACRRGRP